MDINEMQEKFKRVNDFIKMGREIFKIETLTFDQIIQRIKNMASENIELKNKLSILQKQ